MRTQLLRVTGILWITTGLLLAVLAATTRYEMLPGWAAVGLLGAIPGFFCLRGRRWPLWWMAIQSSFLFAVGVLFLGMSALRLHHEPAARHANRDAVIITLFYAFTLIALFLCRKHLASVPQKNFQ